MKKLLLGTALLGALVSTAASAGIDIGINLGGPAYVAAPPPPPAYYAPAPVVIDYDPHHAWTDRAYWNDQRRARWEHDHHQRWEDAHHGGRHF